MQLIYHVAIFYCAKCHNLRLALTIIMDDTDQYFQKKYVQNFS